MRTYRVALLGCRSRGTSQAKAIVQHPRMELVGVCDLLPERLNALGDRFGVAARYTDFEQMLREQQPDIVNIPTATKFHAPLATAVLRLGHHVDVEKPLTLTLAELDQVMTAQRESGKQLVPHHQAAVHPPAKKLRELVKQGFIGEPQAVRLRNKGYYGGYGIIHQGCHALALAISVVGPARAVSAHMVTAGRPTTVDDVYQGPYGYGLVAGQHMTCLYELQNGAYLLNEEHYRPEVDSSTIRFEVVGTEGALALDHAIPEKVYYSNSPHWHPVRTEWSEVPLSKEERAAGGYDFLDPAVKGMDLWMADEWVQALDEGRDHVINASVGVSTMEMIHGAYASHAEGRRIDLPQASRDHPFERWLAREGRPTPPPAPPGYGDWIAWALAQPQNQPPALVRS
ncbi:MAG: Gfo/Idh/MocA family oxidoreductase [Chloroflexi bacterium]|nr:Gfo/Idh/MocA family oxidoreductase [Chloroflexota bacterium]